MTMNTEPQNHMSDEEMSAIIEDAIQQWFKKHESENYWAIVAVNGLAEVELKLRHHLNRLGHSDAAIEVAKIDLKDRVFVEYMRLHPTPHAKRP